MRSLAFVCIAIILGFLVGRWAPHEDLTRARREIEDLQRLVKKSGGGGRGGNLMGVDNLLRIQDRPAATTASTSTNTVGGVTNTVGATGVSTNEVAATPARDRRNLRERLDEAKDVWQMRSDLARNSFLNNLHASEVQSRDFDVLVAAMNLKMEQRINTWVESIKKSEVVRPEDGARLMHALTGAVVETYDEFDQKMPGTWRQAAGEEFMLFDFVNPKVGERLIDVESTLNRSNRAF